MPFTPPAYNPQISCSPYASLARPPAGTVLYDRVYNDDLVTIKVQLKRMLKMNRLSSMPMGFPFHTVFDGHGDSRISRQSYEFQEQFCFSDQRSRTHTATFSYTAPSFREQRMSWRITVPSRESSLNGNIPCNVAPGYPVELCLTLFFFSHPAKISIAHVEVDQMVLETRYGFALMTDPRIILEALSVSIEQGILITVAVANCRTPMFHPTDRHLDYNPGDVIYIATDNDHKSEVVLVFKTWTGHGSGVQPSYLIVSDSLSPFHFSTYGIYILPPLTSYCSGCRAIF